MVENEFENQQTGLVVVAAEAEQQSVFLVKPGAVKARIRHFFYFCRCKIT